MDHGEYGAEAGVSMALDVSMECHMSVGVLCDECEITDEVLINITNEREVQWTKPGSVTVQETW